MNFLTTLFKIIVFTLVIEIYSNAQTEFLIQEGSYVIPTEDIKAQELIYIYDDYISILSKFDLMSKTQIISDTLKKEDYLKKSQETIKSWNQTEIINLGEIVKSVKNKITELNIKLPITKKIYVIKSDMSNEGGASGYTRLNYIVLNENRVSGNAIDWENLFIHELFHIISRYDTLIREKIYNIMGFEKCNEIEYPKEIYDYRISNPDAPYNNYYITVKYEDKPIDVMLILYSSGKYKGGSFFYYMKTGLLALEGDDFNKSVIYKNSKPLILSFKNTDGFYEQTGKNTFYNIHAEELAADNFVFMINNNRDLPNPEIIDAMYKIFNEYR